MAVQPSPEDLTARARIREAAMVYLARDGFDRATVRDIARTAGVSPGLLRHHFGSKEELRQACDTYVLDALREAGRQAARGGAPANPVLVGRSIMPFQAYVARALLDRSQAAAAFFDEIVAMTELWLAHEDAGRADTPAGDRRARAAVIIAMRMGIPLLQAHLSRALGTDASGPEGDRRVVLALLDIHSHPLIGPELAASARALLEQHDDDRGGPPRRPPAATP